MPWDKYFETVALTAAVNEIRSIATPMYDRFFRPFEHMEDSETIMFDVISGHENILRNLSRYEKAQTQRKTNRRSVVMQAPRIANSLVIHATEFGVRMFGGMDNIDMIMTEKVATRVARELTNLQRAHEQTKEFWATSALKGKIYDADLATVLVDYGVDPTHDFALVGTDLWTDDASEPIKQIRDWKKLIEADSYASITGWIMYVGDGAMSKLIENKSINSKVVYQIGAQIAADGKINLLAGVPIEEYSGSFVTDAGARTYLVEDDEIMLIGLCDELTDCPYAPIMDLNAPNSIGNVGPDYRGVMYYAKSQEIFDPSGRQLFLESRPLPVLKRPGAIVRVTVI